MDFIESDKNRSVDDLKEKVKVFCEERGWDSYHNAKDLAIGVATEAVELLELFRFRDPEEIILFFESADKREAIGDELADVFFCLLRFCQLYDFDLGQCLDKKMKKNALKYPGSIKT